MKKKDMPRETAPKVPVRKIIPVLILLIITAIVLINIFQSGDLKLQGIVEGTIYSQVSEVSGKIIEMNVQLGSPVKTGDLIARIDSINQQYTLEQLQIALEKTQLMSQEELIRARGSVSIAEANYFSAQSGFVQARNDADSLERMFEIGGIARNDLDNARHRETLAAQALESAQSQLQTARAHYSFLQNGSDSRNIALAEIDIRDIESRINQMQDMLLKYEIRANCDGIIVSINYNMGSMVSTGYNIADISAEDEKFVVFYMPNEHINEISYGQKITVKSGSEEVQGEVRYIDVRSQYTPKDMQASAMKNKFSVKIKLLLPSVTALIPGGKVDVFVR